MSQDVLTAIIASHDAAWRAELTRRIEKHSILIIGEWDGTGNVMPSAVRFQDNRLESEGGFSMLIRVGLDPHTAFDLPWPFEDAELLALLAPLHQKLSRQGLLQDPALLRSAFERLIELSPDSIEVVDPNVRLLYVNPSFENITGYQLPEVLGRTTGDLFRAGTHDPSFYGNIMNVLREGEVWRGQLVARRADQSLSYQESILAPFFDPEGKTQGFIALKRDLERDNLLNQAIERQDAQHAALFQEVADAFLLHDEAGHLLDRNSRAVRMFNLEAEGEQLQSSLLDSVSQVDQMKLARAWKNLKKEESIEIDAHLKQHPDEDERVVSFRSVRVVVAGEDLILSIARDITIRIALERQARELSEAQSRIQGLTQTLHDERQQEKSARIASLSVLAGSLAHDLNNALSVIMGNLDFLHDADDPDERQEILSDIEHGIKSARDITRRFTSFSRGSAVVLSPLQLQPWLQELTRAFRSGQRVNTLLTMPPEPIWCQADEPQLTQVVLNLLMNAFQAAGADKDIHLTLRAPELSNPASLAVITVEDEGPGLPEDLIARIFEPFVTTKPGGSGLGLASAQRIVKGHNGDLRAYNRSSGGACFEITLPWCTPEGNILPPQENAAESEVEELDLEGLNVVVLDDEPNVLHLIGRLLKGQGATVTLFTTGEHLLKYVSEQLASEGNVLNETVFVLDLLIENGIDGVETLRRLKLLLPHVRAMACSGYPPDPTIDDYRTVGFQVYVKKPFSPVELISAVRKTHQA